MKVTSAEDVGKNRSGNLTGTKRERESAYCLYCCLISQNDKSKGRASPEGNVPRHFYSNAVMDG